MMMMMGSSKACKKSSSSSFGKPKTPRLGISGIDYVNGLAHHGYNHFHMNGGGGGNIVGSILAGTTKTDSHSQLQSIELVQQQQLHLQNNHVDAINKTNSVDRGGCKMKRKKQQPFEPTYYFDSDFDSEDGSGGGRRRGSTTSCSPSIVSRFLRLSRRKSSTSSKSNSRKNSYYSQSQTQTEKEEGISIKNQPQQKTSDAQQQSKRLSEDQQQQQYSGFRGNNNNNRIYPQEDITSDTGQHLHYHPPTLPIPSSTTFTGRQSIRELDDGSNAIISTITSAIEETNSAIDGASSGNGKGLLSPLRERLAAIEELTTSLQSWQVTEKTEYEKCVSDLANQVSRAVALQQLMKSEVEKLQQRVVDLENHNKAMATMIIPTLMKLHDTTMHGIKDGPELKSIEPAPIEDDETTTMTTSDIQCESGRNLIKSQDSLEDSFSSNDPRSCINSSSSGPTHFIAVVSASSTSPSSFSYPNASSQMKTICYEQTSSGTTPTPILSENSYVVETTTTAAASSISSREKITDLLQPPTSSTSAATPIATSSRSPVKAPRTSRAAHAQGMDCRIPKLNGSSSGNIIGGLSTSSLSRSNSCSSNKGSNVQNSNNESPSVAGVISLIESGPCSSSSKCDDDGNQSQIISSNNQTSTSLELSTSSSITSSLTTTGPISNNSEMSNNLPVSNRNTNNNSNNSRSTSRTSLSAGSSGIPRMSSPARSKIPCGQQPASPAVKPRRAANTNQSNNHERSSSPHGSKLPVRKTSVMTSSAAGRHPAATSKSLPANSNMGTAFQSMSKSTGPGQGSKHSKSTFGFGSKKSSTNNNNTSSSNSARNSDGGTKNGNKSNSPCSTNITNLPDCSGNGSGSNSVSTTKPIKLVASCAATVGSAATAIGNITKASGNGKDEGYSTMEDMEHHALRHNNSLEKSSQQRVTINGGTGNKIPLLPVATVPPTTFSSIKVGNAKTGTLPLSSSSTCTGNKTRMSSGSSTASTTATTSAAEAGANRNSIHKSNTFNTFREIAGESSGRKEQSRIYNSTCDADDDDEYDEDNSLQVGKSNYTRGRGRVMAAVSNFSQYTSLPNSSSSASSSPSKGKLGGAAVSSAVSTKKRSAKSKDRITATTRMMDGNIVRIVRGSPYSIQLGDESGDDMEDEEDPSSSTILWEDSDDSDILFLPFSVEASASSATSSRSTLVPPPQSSGESRSCYSSWGRGTTTTCSTLEKGSNTSVNNSGTSNNSNTFSRRAYPLRRTKGEVANVDILLVNNQANISNGSRGREVGAGSGDNTSCSSSNNTSGSNPPSEGKIIRSNNTFGRIINGSGSNTIGKSSNNKGRYSNGSDAVSSSSCGDSQPIKNGHVVVPINDDNSTTTTDEYEEKALIEKWMQLEEVRNERQNEGEQWAWDWDGVERTYTKVLRRGGMRQHQLSLRQFENDEDDIDVDLILEEAGLPSPEVDEEETANIGLHEPEQEQGSSNMQIDSSTWTKSKSNKKSCTSASNKEEASPKKTDETVMVVSEAGERKSGNNSQEASPEKVRRRDEEEGDQILIVLEGEREMENEDGLLIKRARDGTAQDAVGKRESPKKSPKTHINLDENGIVVTSSGGSGDCGEEADGEEDDPPPVIEFTPEFYRLANFGSNLSFSDNDSTQTSTPNSPKVSNSSTTGGSNSHKSGMVNNSGNNAATTSSTSPAVRSPKRRKHLTRRSHSVSNNSSDAIISSEDTQTTMLETSALKTDDKISQTDFSCSSLENMSSVSSDLSAECRNCLEIIKKLVSHADTEAEEEESSNGGGFAESEENGAFRDENAGIKSQATGEVDAGSYATTWISVPKGLPSAEMDRILEILSSSESEGVLSPSK